MRILFLIRSLGSGGAERQLTLLANGLAERGHEIHIATFYRVPGRASELNKSIRVHYLEKRGRWNILGFFRRYLGTCRKIQPDVIHSVMPAANLISALGSIFTKSRIIWGIRTSKVPYELYDHYFLSRAIESLARLLSRLPDLIICNSQAGSDWYSSEGFPISRIIVIPNGIDTSNSYPQPSLGRTVRARIDIPESSYVVGFVGRLDPVKNLPSLIEAFSNLGELGNDAYLVIVGDGAPSYLDKLHKQVQLAGVAARVRFRPGAEISEVMQAFDIGVSSSLSEGFSNVIGELMSCEKPCVVTDVGDSAFIIGDTGIVVRPNSALDLSRGISLLLSEGKNSISERGHRGRTRIIELFSVEKLVDRTERALRDLVVRS